MVEQKRKPHWTYARTAKREKLIENLRELCEAVYPDQGERQNGMLTTSQILDWALEDLEIKMRDIEDA